MNLYLLHSGNTGYDEFDEIVVCAASPTAARMIHPRSSSPFDTYAKYKVGVWDGKDNDRTWKDADKIDVQFIGKAAKGRKGTGKVPCPKCAASGIISDIGHVSFEGKTHFTYPEDELPPGVPALIDQIGPGMVIHDHADIDILRKLVRSDVVEGRDDRHPFS